MDGYFAYVLAAYAVSAAALAALGLVLLLDSRRTQRRLLALEASSQRRRSAPEGTTR